VRGLRKTLIWLLLPCCIAAAEASAGAPPRRAQVDDNPCLTPEAQRLRCPDLLMKPPYGLGVDLITRPGRVLLRAGNSIDSVGAGPAELHGRRTGRYLMRARQRIYRRGGGRLGVRTGARLFFKFVPGQRRYWKFHNAARFELWSLDSQGRRKRRVRVGPKVSYCLRDLRRTRPRLRGSPGARVYPSCNTSGRIDRVTLGTSIGWSDIYPPAYPEQWIDVTGLRGCFAYVHIADPLDRLYESDEDNNEGRVIVRLPYRKRARRCPGQRRAAPAPRDPGYHAAARKPR
jgi:hypothetical protein